jgi:hypothetical protein
VLSTPAARLAAVLAATSALLLSAGPPAYADTGAAQAPPPSLIGDVNLLTGLAVCPDLTTALGLGNVLGLLGVGNAYPVANGGDVRCDVDVDNGAGDNAPIDVGGRPG